MALRDFKVLTFDVVGTLIDFETGVLNAVRRIGGPAAAKLSDDAIVRMVCMQELEESHASADGLNVFTMVRRIGQAKAERYGEELLDVLTEAAQR